MLLPPDTTLETARLTLRLVQESDLPALFIANSDDAVTRYLPYASWKDMSDAHAWLDRAVTRFAANEAAQFVVEQRHSKDVIGSCLIFHFEPTTREAEVGYVLAQAHWGAGNMFEAMSAFASFAFDRFELKRLVARVDPANVASARLLERLGFVKESETPESLHYGMSAPASTDVP